MGVGIREWGITRGKQVIIMGQRVRVGHRVGWKGKYIFLNVIALGTSVRSHKVPNRRIVTIIGKSGCGRGVLSLALACTLHLGLS